LWPRLFGRIRASSRCGSRTCSSEPYPRVPQTASQFRSVVPVVAIAEPACPDAPIASPPMSDGFDLGQEVASTDPAAAQHALTDTVPHNGLQRAAVLSDGATRLVDRFGLLDWPSFLDVLAEQGTRRDHRPGPSGRGQRSGRATLAAWQAPRRRLRRLLPPDLTLEPDAGHGPLNERHHPFCR
jgi:hypothetical protein